MFVIVYFKSVTDTYPTHVTGPYETEREAKLNQAPNSTIVPFEEKIRSDVVKKAMQEELDKYGYLDR